MSIDGLVKALDESAKRFDAIAAQMEDWANESKNGGWSTHQVTANRVAADKARQDAAYIRQALKESGNG